MGAIPDSALFTTEFKHMGCDLANKETLMCEGRKSEYSLKVSYPKSIFVPPILNDSNIAKGIMVHTYNPRTQETGWVTQ